MHFRVAALALAAFCAATAPSSAASVADSPFYGTWTVSETKAGPWVAATDNTPMPNPELLNATFTFMPASVTAPEPLGCAKAVYEFKTVPPEFLFEGGLTDAKPQARALGFTTDTFPAMSFSCDRSDADVSMDYSLADANTIVFALDNVIYILKRTPPEVIPMKFVLAVLGVLAFAAAAQAAEKTCKAEIGAERASRLVAQCIDISPATHPPCNADNPCALIKSEIQRGCQLARDAGDAPDYCAQYPASSGQPSGY